MGQRGISEVEEKSSSDALVNLTRDDLIALVQAARGESEVDLRRRAKIDAEEMAKATGQQATRPDPCISAFSYPEGDLARPRPELRCKMFWVGHPLSLDCVTAKEIELLNQMEPGEYQITKTDGSSFKLTVVGEHNAAGNLAKLEFQFPVRGEHKYNVPSMAAMLAEALHQEDPVLAEAQAEITRLRKLVQQRAS